MRKNIFITLSILIIVLSSYSQNIKFKKGFVYINKVKVFKFEESVWRADYHFYDMNTKEKLVSVENNEDGVQISFLVERITFETKKGWLSKREFLKDLFSNKVIDEKGIIDIDNLTFYVEKNEQKTLRIR